MGFGRWEPFATLCAVTANPHRNERKKREPFTSRDFNPLAAFFPIEKPKPLQVGIEALKIFLPKQ